VNYKQRSEEDENERAVRNRQQNAGTGGDLPGGPGVRQGRAGAGHGRRLAVRPGGRPGGLLQDGGEPAAAAAGPAGEPAPRVGRQAPRGLRTDGVSPRKRQHGQGPGIHAVRPRPELPLVTEGAGDVPTAVCRVVRAAEARYRTRELSEFKIEKRRKSYKGHILWGHFLKYS